jgi:2-polyprenyl-3-methyl-5-hydroxy-6-metoxy-1,4-benzoquinol methylase
MVTARLICIGLLSVFCISGCSVDLEAPADLVAASGVQGGIVVHIGCGDGRETASMLLNSSYFVHGLDTSEDNISRAREYLRSKNLYGQVSVAKYDGKTLPYGDVRNT